MNDSEKQILEDILEKEGDCLDWKNCVRCPFKSKCLLNVITQPKSMYTKRERVNLALNKLTNEILLDDKESYETT